MKITDVARSIASIELTADEIRIVNNALNGVCNGIHLEGEFETRMGFSMAEAKRLLAEINKLGRSMVDYPPGAIRNHWGDLVVDLSHSTKPVPRFREDRSDAS